MNDMHNQQQTLAKLRAELERREERKCFGYKGFRHLAYNCRNQKEVKKRKPIPHNKFEMLASRVVRCSIREKVKVRRQEKEKLQYFRCWEVGHFKWECSMTVAEKERQREEEAVHMARPQKAQQETRPACPTQEKVQEYCDEWNMPLEGALLLDRGQITEEVVVTYVDCRGYESKRVQTYKNQGQSFLLKR